MQTMAVKPEDLPHLSQGSIVDISLVTFRDGNDEKSFFDFYDVTRVKWAVVLTQDCDLANEDKVEYITVGLLDPFHKRVDKLIDEFEETIGKEFLDSGQSQFIYEKESLANWAATKFKKVIENDHNYYIFLTLPDDETKFYVVNLTKIFSLKIDHREALKDKCYYKVTNGFNYLLGWKLAYLYGRVGVDNYGDARVDVGKELAPQIIEAAKKRKTGQYFAVNKDQKKQFENLINSLEQAANQLEYKYEQYTKADEKYKEIRFQSFEKQKVDVKKKKEEIQQFISSLESM